MAKRKTTRYTNPVLIIGGGSSGGSDTDTTANTIGNRIASHLATLGIPAVTASPSGVGPNGVRFDWHDASTWPGVFEGAGAVPHNRGENDDPDDNEGIRAVYLVGPPSGFGDGDGNGGGGGGEDVAGVVMDFVDFAREKLGGKNGSGMRFVLQSESGVESGVEAGGPALGKVHAYLRELGTRGEVEWAVLRPTWFQQTLAERQNYVRSIRDESRLYSATGGGKIPWVSVEDLAAVAVQMLTRPDAPNTEFVVLGPELLSYDHVARMLSDLLGRKIVHIDLSTTELVDHYLAAGIPSSYAKMLSSLDTSVKFGSENRTNDVVLSVTGVAPRPFRQFLEEAKAVWAPVSSEA
ncbi:hypothetical protein QBC47DRAFT_323651 [Echria macrotheca]|uniref:Ergot alkaloid biosynthetic protein A n=1 Tax=Echria macrotheca TaxID=438768 RepID=A0AAJ0F4W4_9PEZI|nr:hypothetical protein QBC47DRAFT_323651 [Echria macrotheca]